MRKRPTPYILETPTLPNLTLLFVTLAALIGPSFAPPVFAQGPVFVLPNLGPAPAAHSASTPAPDSQPSTPIRPPAGNSLLTTPAPGQPSSPLSRTGGNPSPNASHHPQPEVSAEMIACRKRYAAAIYDIGLALWTAPEVQRSTLGRLLNAATAAQSEALAPRAAEQTAAFCSDSTLNGLESTVVRLRQKGWVPMTQSEEHIAHTADVGDELKNAINAISR